MPTAAATALGQWNVCVWHKKSILFDMKPILVGLYSLSVKG
jgi:hypothetical protein